MAPDPPDPQHSAYTWVTPGGHVQFAVVGDVNMVAAVPVGDRPAEAFPPDEPPPPPTDPVAVRPVPPAKVTAFPDVRPPSAPVAEFCAADFPPFAVTTSGPDGPGPNTVGCPSTGLAPAVPPRPT